MSLQRGTFGIEYDERQNSPFRRLWIPVVLILVVTLALFFYRGEGASDSEVPADGQVGQTRYRVPELETTRERPSFWRHFLFSKRTETPAAITTPAAVTKAPDRPQDKIQSAEVRKLLDQALAFETADDKINARLIWQRVLIHKDAESVRAFVERKIGALNTELIFGNRPMPEKVRYRIEAGDLISRIAKRFGDTQEYLLKVNGIDRPQLLRIGREIWVLKDPVFELTVFKKASSAVLTLNGRFFKRYEIGLGRPGDVPGGTYAIRGKVTDPRYRLPGGTLVEAGHVRNILGSRWVPLSATGETPSVARLGLHGTPDISSLGRPSDAGYVRFSNADIEELCTLLPLGTAVNIAE